MLILQLINMYPYIIKNFAYLVRKVRSIMQAKNNIILQTSDIVECETPMQIDTLPLIEEASFSDWQQEIPKKCS